MKTNYEKRQIKQIRKHKNHKILKIQRCRKTVAATPLPQQSPQLKDECCSRLVTTVCNVAVAAV
jgi:hypothetical protein